MKFKFLIVLLILSSCQAHNSGLKSDISNYLQKQGSPTLLALQFLTIELNRETEKWPKSTNEYVQIFGDSVNTLFSKFEELKFKHQNDTLLILYTLRNPQGEGVTNSIIEFIDPQLYADSEKVKITLEIEVENVNKEGMFKPNEGRIYFYKINDYHLSIVHEYEGGISKNKITTAQYPIRR